MTKSREIDRFVLRSIEYFDTESMSFRCADVEIEDNLIIGIRPPGSVVAPRIVNGRNLLCVPGLVNAHLHPSKEVYRGLYRPGTASSMLDAVHKNNRTESEDDQSIASTIALAEMALQGVTSVGIFTSRARVDAIAARASGLRSAIFFSQNDQWTGGGEVPKTHDLVNIIKNFDDVYDAYDAGNLSINPATASEYSASEELLNWLHHIAVKRKRSFSMHIAEGGERAEAFAGVNNETGVARLSRLGLLDQHTTLVHLSALTVEDVELLQQRPVRLVHCPISNAFTSAGKMPLHMLIQGHDVGLGTDSAMINPINRIAFEAAFAMHSHAMTENTVRNIVEMITVKGAKSINLANTGVIRPGFSADLCIFEPIRYRSPDAAIHLLELYLTGRPKTVIVSGKFIVDDYNLTSQVSRDQEEKYMLAQKRLTMRLAG